MKEHSIDWLLAFGGGLLLALMINFNSLLAKHTTPLFASWLAHAVGGISSFLFVLFFAKKNSQSHHKIKKPFWAYGGGIAGSLTVVLAGITVNTKLGLSGSLAFMLLGQVLFGIVTDICGLFGVPQRRLMFSDFIVVFFVLLGSGIIIFFRV